MNLYIWGLTIFAAFGSFMFGYDIGVINGVKEMPGFRETLDISSNGNNSCSENVEEAEIIGLIVSVFSLGCLFGALTAGVLSDVLGRKPAIMIGGVVFIVGGALQSAAFYIWMILLGRVVAGLGVGILSMVVPVYNAELAPKNLRGRLVSLTQLAITAGIMVSFVVDLVCERFRVGWRVALGIQCLLGIILIIGMLFLPETPRWLVKKQKVQKAAAVLARIRKSSEEGIQEELSEIQGAVEKGQKPSILQMWRAFFQWKIIQRVIIGMMLQLFQQLTGMNVIMYYSTSIFCKIGVAGYAATAIVGTLNFLTTILSIFLVDKVGRKALLLLGALGMLVSMAFAATLILGFQVEEGGSTAVGYIVVFFICFFVFNFAYGWGPTAWVVTSEIFPLHIREIAVSLTTATNWSGNFIIAMVTPVLLASQLQTHGTFYILCGFLLAAFFFVLLTLPETKGQSLERIEELFAKPWLERIDLFYYLRCGCPWWRNSRQYRVTEFTRDDLIWSDEAEVDDTALLLQDDENGRLEFEGETVHFYQ